MSDCGRMDINHAVNSADKIDHIPISCLAQDVFKFLQLEFWHIKNNILWTNTSNRYATSQNTPCGFVNKLLYLPSSFMKLFIVTLIQLCPLQANVVFGPLE